MVKYLLVVEKEIWRRFKSKCALDGKRIKEKLLEFILAYIED